MKAMRKTRISMALATALAGVGVSSHVGAVNLTTDGLGDVGIFPYYTTRDGWTTSFLVTNTSDSTAIIKVRFHEAANSREVLDFIAVLSPFDQFGGNVVEGPDGPILLLPAKTDSTCVVANYDLNNFPGGRNPFGGYLPFRTNDYNGQNEDWDGTNEQQEEERGGIDRARQGYFTIIEMGTQNPGMEEVEGTVAFNALHDTGNPDVPADCQAVVDAFQLRFPGELFQRPPGERPVDQTYRDTVRNLNHLKFQYAMTNVGRGIQGSGEAVTLANFGTAVADLEDTDISRANAVTAECAGARDDVNAAIAALDPLWTDYRTQGLNLHAVGGACTLVPSSAFPDFPPTASSALTAGAFPTLANPTGCILLAGTNTVENFGTARTAVINPYNNLIALQNAEDSACDDEDVVLNLISAQDVYYDKFPNLNSGDTDASFIFVGEQSAFSPFCRDGAQPVGDYDGSGEAEDLGTVGTRGCGQSDYRGWDTARGFDRGVDAVSWLLTHASVINEWADNTTTGAYVDWVVTSPTKRFYTDPEHVAAPLWLAQAPVTPPYPFAQPWDYGSWRHSCDDVSMRLWSRDERFRFVAGGDQSPQDPFSMCWEANVYQFGTQSVLNARDDLNTQIGAKALLNAAGLTNEQAWNGWAELVTWTGLADQYLPSGMPIMGDSWDSTVDDTLDGWDPLPEFLEEVGCDSDCYAGLPVVGFAIKERQLGNMGSYAGIVDHSYIRIPLRSWTDLELVNEHRDGEIDIVRSERSEL